MKKTFIIEDLDCAHCAAKMEEEIAKIPTVTSVSVNFLAGKLTLEAEESNFQTALDAALAVIKTVEPDCKVVI